MLESHFKRKGLTRLKPIKMAESIGSECRDTIKFRLLDAKVAKTRQIKQGMMQELLTGGSRLA